MGKFALVCLGSFVILCVTQPGVTTERNGNPDPQCQVFYFYDHGTELCEHCRGICDLAAVKRTEEQCRTQCADYRTSQLCTKDEYFDVNVRQCSPCSELCDHRDVRGTASQCQSLCTQYLTAKESPVNTTKPSNQGKQPEKTSSLEQVNVIIIVVALLLAVFLVLLLAVYAYVKRPWRYAAVTKYDRTPTSTMNAGSDNNVDAVVVLEEGDDDEEGIWELRRPQAETQPCINSELVANGT